MRTNSVMVALILGVAIFFGTGCGNAVKKEVLGIWYIEDTKLSGDTSSTSPEQYRYIIEDQKDLRFELKEDSVISIYTGSSEIGGVWYYNRKSKSIMVILEGNYQPTRLGKYVNGNLVNSDTNNLGVIITTIFKKEVPLVPEQE